MHEDDVEHIHLGDETDPAIYTGEHVRLRSAGIDIGSSTSHLVFSDLVLTRQGRALSSRYHVTHREVRFRSRVVLTPYASPHEIDTAGVARFVGEAYEAAGVGRSEIDTGAVIITGEAALKENAAPLLQLFAQDAGRFVCATAGPHLESLLAAHGSGAAALSHDAGHPVVLNVDIGGGTTKFAVCRGGAVAETAALHLGARLLAWGPDGVLERVEEAGRALAQRCAGVELRPGATVPARCWTPSRSAWPTASPAWSAAPPSRTGPRDPGSPTRSGRPGRSRTSCSPGASPSTSTAARPRSSATSAPASAGRSWPGAGTAWSWSRRSGSAPPASAPRSTPCR